MELSKRLQCIKSLITDVSRVVDIGTDHGYIPINLVKNSVCNYVVAGDINKGPLEKAEYNIKREGLNEQICCRLGGGFSVVEKGEVQCAIIAGMGGDLIRDIIENDIEKFKELKYAIVQPVQNVDVFRKYIYDKGFRVIEEKMCVEDDKFYEILKISYDSNTSTVDPIFFEISKNLLINKDEVLVHYIEFLINKYEGIVEKLNQDTENVLNRKMELCTKIDKLRKCLDGEVTF